MIRVLSMLSMLNWPNKPEAVYKQSDLTAAYILFFKWIMALESVRSSWFLLYFDNFTTFHSRSIKHFTLWCIYPLKTTRSEAHEYIYKSSSFIYLNRIACPACTSSTTRTTSATSNRSVTWTCAKAHIKWTSTTNPCHCQKSQPSISRLESRSKTPKRLP